MHSKGTVGETQKIWETYFTISVAGDREIDASSQKCSQITCSSDSDECYPQNHSSTSHSCVIIMDRVGTLYLEAKKAKMFINGMELTVIVETQAECKEFIRSPRYRLCYKRQMQVSADRYKIKHMGIHSSTIMGSKLAIVIKKMLDSLFIVL